jgi:AcrR family transcriptional regulator
MTEVPALRERRKAQTALEVADAALDLFEAQGVDATRIEDIAAAAGISKRTFFRYFAGKEHAAFAKDPEILAALEDGIAALTHDRPLLAQLEDVQRAVVRLHADVSGPSGRRSLRLWRLIQTEPGLAQVGAGVHEEVIRELAERLRDYVADDMELDLVLSLWQATAMTAYRQWAAELERSSTADLLAIYDRCCALRRSVDQAA